MTKTIRFEEDTLVKVHLWDIAGQERFGGMTRVYYKGWYAISRQLVNDQ